MSSSSLSHQQDGRISEFLELTAGIGRYDKKTFRKMLNENNKPTMKTPAYVTLVNKRDDLAHMFPRMIDAGWMTVAEAKEILPNYNDFKIKPSGGNRRRSTQSKKYKKNTKRSKRTRHARIKRYSRKT